MKLKCSYCDRLGHDVSVCYHKKNFIRKNKINLSSKRSHLKRPESSQKAEKAKKICSYCNKSDHIRQNVTIRKDLVHALVVILLFLVDFSMFCVFYMKMLIYVNI